MGSGSPVASLEIRWSGEGFWQGMVIGDPGLVERDLFKAMLGRQPLIYFDVEPEDGGEPSRIVFQTDKIVSWVVGGRGLPDEPNLKGTGHQQV